MRFSFVHLVLVQSPIPLDSSSSDYLPPRTLQELQNLVDARAGGVDTRKALLGHECRENRSRRQFFRYLCCDVTLL